MVGRNRAVLVACALLVPALALAHPEVDAAQRSYEDGAFASALARLGAAEKDPALTRPELVKLRWLKGACLFAMGRRAKAEAAFDELVSLEPLFEPGPADASPPMRAALGRRRATWREAHGVELADAALEPGAVVTVQLAGHVEDVASLVIYARAHGDIPYQPFRLNAGGTSVRGQIPDVALWERAGKSGGMDLVLEARNAAYAAVARRGTATEPLRLAVPADVAAGAAEALRSLERAASPVRDAPVATPAPVHLAQGRAPAEALPELAPPPPPGTERPPPAPPPREDPPPPVETPAPAPPPPTPPPAAESGPPLRALMLGGGTALFMVAGVAALAGAGGAALSSAGYGLSWVQPRYAGAEVSPLYRALVAAWIGGGVLAVLAAAGALGAGGLGAALLVLGFVLG